jgi:transposase
VSEVTENNIPVQIIADFLSLSRNQIYRMIDKIRTGGTLQSHRGRPPLIDIQSQEEIKLEISQALNDKRALDSGELAKLMLEKAKKTSLSNGGNGQDFSSQWI